MKKKVIALSVAGGMVVVAAIGGSLAAFNTSTEGNAGAGITTLTTSSIDVTGVGSYADQAVIEEEALPGNTYACGYKVTNSVKADKKGYDIYVKVTLDKTWENGEDLDGQMATILYDKDQSYDGKAGEKMTNDWLVGYEDSEQLVLYYTRPLKQGESTKNFMDAVGFSEKMNNAYTDSDLKLDFEIAAVQTNAKEDAIQAEWGVYPKISEDGKILNVYETRAERDAVK